MDQKVRGIRGAIQVAEDTPAAVLAGTSKLLAQMFESNSIEPGEIISATFTTTPDLRSAFPAEAARYLGLSDTPLICSQEIDVPGSLGRVVRILLLVYTGLEKSAIRHIYLDGAEILRKDVAQ